MKPIVHLKTISRRYGSIACPFLLVFGVGCLFYVFPYRIIPDYINIKGYTKIYELFTLIISSLVSLIGIYISVSLVAYEFFKQKSGIDFHKTLLVNRVNALYISFTVSTIIFAFISSILIPSSNPDWNEVTVIYYNAILFAGVIACLFPVAFNLFSSLKPEKLAHDELEQITKDTIFISAPPNDDIDEEVALIENDHLVKVENITIALIAVSDNIKAQALIQKITRKLASLIIDETNPANNEYISRRLISCYIRITDFALLQPNNAAILENIWLGVARIYDILVERKETLAQLETFRKGFFERYFHRLLENDKDEIVIEGITTIRDIIQRQVLLNTADDNKIHYFNDFRRSVEADFEEPEEYSDDNFKSAEHWRLLAGETLDIITFIINKGINLHKPDLINTCFGEINDLNFQLHLKRAGIYKQCYFYIKSASIIADYGFHAFEKGVFTKGHEAQHLIPPVFEKLIFEKHPCARTVLQKYCHLLINLQKIGKLDHWFLGGLTIGEIITTDGNLGHIAKRCAVEFHRGKEVQDCLEDCISTFVVLKEYYEIHPPEKPSLYKVIKWQFGNILDWMEKKQPSEGKIIADLKNLIASFREQP